MEIIINVNALIALVCLTAIGVAVWYAIDMVIDELEDLSCKSFEVRYGLSKEKA